MPVYEGDPEVAVTPCLEITRGASANVSLLSLGSHRGTHVDAPAHFIAGEASAPTSCRSTCSSARPWSPR